MKLLSDFRAVDGYSIDLEKNINFRVRGNKEEYNLYLDHPGSIFGSSPSVFQNYDPGAICAWGLARPTPVPRPLDFHLGSGRWLGLWSSQYMSGQKWLYKKELSFPLLKTNTKNMFRHVSSFFITCWPRAVRCLRPLGPWCRARRVLQLLGCGPPVSLNLSTGENVLVGTGTTLVMSIVLKIRTQSKDFFGCHEIWAMAMWFLSVLRPPGATKSTRRLDWLDWFWTIGFPWVCHWIS